MLTGNLLLHIETNCWLWWLLGSLLPLLLGIAIGYLLFSKYRRLAAELEAERNQLKAIMEGNGESASFKTYVNPLMSWMWVGGVVMILGTLAAVWPHRKEPRRVEVRDTAARGVQPA